MIDEAPTLAATELLLACGGDARIVPDPCTGLSPYGCGTRPDPELVALGSSTASVISTAGFAAAEVLRARCVAQLRHDQPAAVYAREMAQLRVELLRLCGFDPADGVEAVMAASGTDLHLLVARCLRPALCVMINPSETGSGVPAALAGRHFNARAAYGGAVAAGAPLDEWRGELATLAARADDGSLRDARLVDAECAARVDAAAGAGQAVLLVLTDTSKTGLIVPGVATVLALQARWPGQVAVLVDACQFRLAPATVRAYVARDWMVAVTGSKFIAGPTFCGALMVAPGAARALRAAADAGLGAYSCCGDWPAAWPVAAALPAAANFGLLLRWRAALAELARFAALPDALVADWLRRFGVAVRAALAADPCFEEVPVAAPERRALGLGECWDEQQSVFSFLLFAPDGAGGRRPLRRDETERIHRALLRPAQAGARRFQLGQPVACGQRGAIAVSALRLCVSAPMLVDACAGRADPLADAHAALDALRAALTAGCGPD